MSTLELIAIGDVSLICPEGRDPFRHVARYLQAGDIVFGNLESVLCTTGIALEKETTLRAPPSMAGYLRRAGFDIVSVANNHALDFGPAGLMQTLSTLREHGIHSVGAGERLSGEAHAILECKGLRIGFLGYCDTDAPDPQEKVFINRIDRDTIVEQVHSHKPHCDVLIVSLHWGFEHVYYPSPGQVGLAHDLIEAGAALVLGHHPHVVQGIEEYRGGTIVYSLGGFQFEPFAEGTERSFLLRARISPRGVERCRVVPVRINEESLPRLARGRERREILDLVQRISRPLREGRITERWWLDQMAGTYLRVHLAAWRRRVKRYGIRHFIQFLRWVVSGFTIKCCLQLLRRQAGIHRQGTLNRQPE
jgi:poly-gamma-glutamate capsule biosynthesis protein CapA/YwtB (metallophosphatase superfamily)